MSTAVRNSYMNLKASFEAAGQGHVFAFYNELCDQEQEALIDQLQQIDLKELAQLTDCEGAESAVDLNGIEPAEFRPLPKTDEERLEWSSAAAVGMDALLAGRVAAFTVAGGQGTR
ncbi:MAG: UDPGP type 1 family protein, partial [Verrucomicrobiota bacterium]